MRVVCFDDCRLGILDLGHVFDVADLVDEELRGQEALLQLMSEWSRLRPLIEDLCASARGIPIDAVRLRAPVPKPGKILGMRTNFREGTTAVGPLKAFLASPEAISGPGDTTFLPREDIIVCHHEAELVCVIGEITRDVSEADALDHIFGYTAGVDISIRHRDDWGPFGKSCDGFKPIGPSLVTRDEVSDPNRLQVRLRVDDELRQDYNTSDMAHSVAECVSWFSRLMTLLPGDLLFLGTNHQQLGALQDGEQVEMAIDEIGTFSFRISDPLHRSWPKGIDKQLGQRVRESISGT